MSTIGLSERSETGRLTRKPARRPAPRINRLAFTLLATAALATPGVVRAAQSVGIAGLGLPSEECFDNVAVVLNDRPSRTPATPPASKAARGAQDANSLPPPDDAQPVLTVFVKQPRACSAYPDVAVAAPVRGLGVMADPLSASSSAADIVAMSSASFPGLPLAAFPLSSAQMAAEAPPGLPIGLRLAGGPDGRDPTARGRSAASGHGPSPLSFAPSAADDLARALSRDGSAVDPLAPPDLIEPSAQPGLVSPQPGLPEPSTWLLLIAGVFGIGSALRRHTPRLLV